MGKMPPIISDNTAQEDARIRAAIADDPDTWEAAPETPVRKRGRPAGSNKTRVTLHFDNDLLERLKADGKGWQTRANAILRKAMGL